MNWDCCKMLPCHCEPVRLSGVAIRFPCFLGYGFSRQCAHWLRMTGVYISSEALFSQISSAATVSSSRIFRFWGQISSHLPHLMHSAGEVPAICPCSCSCRLLLYRMTHDNSCPHTGILCLHLGSALMWNAFLCSIQALCHCKWYNSNMGS